MPETQNPKLDSILLCLTQDCLVLAGCEVGYCETSEGDVLNFNFLFTDIGEKSSSLLPNSGLLLRKVGINQNKKLFETKWIF